MTNKQILDEFDRNTKPIRELKYDSELKKAMEELFAGIKFFLSKALVEQRKEVMKDMIELSDRIEAEKETPDINEWKAFKHFRNTMRYKLKEL